MNAIRIGLDLYDLTTLAVLFVGFTFVALLWTSRSDQENRFPALALGIILFQLTGEWAVRTGVADRFQEFNGWPWRLCAGVGPLIFFYVRKLTRPEKGFRLRDSLHFIPLAMQILLPLSSAAWSGYGAEPVQWLVSLYNGWYIFRSARQVRRFREQQTYSNGDRTRLTLRWLYRVLIAFSVAWFLWIPIGLFARFYDLPADLSLLLVSLLAIRVSAKLYLKSVAPPEPETASVFLTGESVALRQKGIWLKQVVKEKRCYEDPELSLQSLAKNLDLHTHELSRILNSALKKNFNDFINERRVIEVIRRIRNPAYDKLSLLGIAFECGFNSKTTFNRVFRQMTRSSPIEYKNRLEKERPSYNTGRPPGPHAVFSFRQTSQNWFYGKSNRNFMLKNYFTTAWRNLKRNKSYALINVTGLAIGIAACLLIFLIVRYETSFDTYHKKKDFIYRVVSVSNGADGKTLGSGTQLPLTQEMRVRFPELPLVSSIMQNDGSHFATGNAGAGGSQKKFKEDLTYYADPEFFEIFDFQWLAGNKKNALRDPDAMVLTRDEADKFFGDWHKAMGQVVRYENKRDFKVSGIIENTPVNSDFPLKVIMSWTTLVSKGGDLSGNAEDWVSTFGDKHTYVILPPNLSEKRFDNQLAAFAKTKIPAPYNKNSSLELQPLTDMHYNKKVNVFGHHQFSKQLIDVISLIGLFLLIIACVNFVNLSTAQAVNRSREVGIRKVLGSNRLKIIVQFLCETLIITLVAIAVAAIIAAITLPFLNDLLETKIALHFLLDFEAGAFLCGVIVAVTLLAGFYPALVLSAFNPIEALKNKIKAGRASGLSLRRVLVITQFGIAQLLVIGTLVVVSQMDHFNKASLGFTKEAVITVPVPQDSLSRTRINSIRNEILRQPGVSAVSLSIYAPSDNSGWYSDFRFDNSEKAVEFGACLKWSDPEYFKLYNIPFLAGHAYNNTDTISGYVVNETLIHKLGIRNPEAAIGKKIMIWNNPNCNQPITGVVKDFNVASLRTAIPPVLMAPWSHFYSKLNIKLAPANVGNTLAGIESIWNKTFPEGVYEYQFLDKTIADFYKNERQLSTLYKIFAGMAIFISCLGLYGLVSFMAVQRVKEVGIRKTLGASVGNIVFLFSREFTLLIIVAFAIAAPLGFYFMHQWLEDFSYRIDIGPMIFILAMAGSVLIAWITVGYKAIRAAMASPVKSLKTE